MKITIITPTKNLDAFLQDAIDCVKCQCYFYEIEHLVILDCKHLVLPKSIKSKNYELKYIQNFDENGPSNARNIGLENCNGEIIFFLDADDLWERNYISTIVNLYIKNKNISAISTLGYVFHDKNNLIKNKMSNSFLKSGNINFESIGWNIIGCPSGFSYRYNNDTNSIRFCNKTRFFEDYLFYLSFILKKDTIFYRCNSTNYWYRKSKFQATSMPNFNLVIQSNLAFNYVLKKMFIYQKNDKVLKIANIQLTRLTRKLLGQTVYFYTFRLVIAAPSYLFSILQRSVITFFKLPIN